MTRSRVIILITVIGVFFMFLMIFQRGSFKTPDLNETSTLIALDEGVEITKAIDDSKKVTNFIALRLPEESAAVELEHSKHSHHVSNNELLRNLFEQLFTGIVGQDIDFVSVAFSADSLRSVLSDTDNIIPEEMMEGIAEFNAIVNAEGTLQSIEYEIIQRLADEQLIVDLTLKYDVQELKLPVTVGKFGDSGHAAFQIVTPMKTIVSYVQNEKTSS